MNFSLSCKYMTSMYMCLRSSLSSTNNVPRINVMYDLNIQYVYVTVLAVIAHIHKESPWSQCNDRRQHINLKIGFGVHWIAYDPRLHEKFRRNHVVGHLQVGLNHFI